MSFGLNVDIHESFLVHARRARTQECRRHSVHSKAALLYVQVYRAKKNIDASNESPQLRVKLRAVTSTVTRTGAVAGTVAMELTTPRP